MPPNPFLTDRPTVRRRLSQESIVAAGLEILAADGLDAVTMRAVATRLGTGAASLYAHVRDKGDLHRLMLDEVLGGVDVPEADPKRWQAQLKEVLRSILAVLRAHPGVAEINLGSIPFGPNSLRSSERMIAILRAGRVSPQLSAWAVDLLALYPTALAFEETMWAKHAGQAGSPPVDQTGDLAGGPVAGGGADPEDWDILGARIRAFFAGLPVAQFPLLSSMSEELTNGAGDERFEFGLDVLVSGLAAVARRDNLSEASREARRSRGSRTRDVAWPSRPD